MNSGRRKKKKPKGKRPTREGIDAMEKVTRPTANFSSGKKASRNCTPVSYYDMLCDDPSSSGGTRRYFALSSPAEKGCTSPLLCLGPFSFLYAAHGMPFFAASIAQAITPLLSFSSFSVFLSFSPRYSKSCITRPGQEPLWAEDEKERLARKRSEPPRLPPSSTVSSPLRIIPLVSYYGFPSPALFPLQKVPCVDTNGTRPMVLPSNIWSADCSLSRKDNKRPRGLCLLKKALAIARQKGQLGPRAQGTQPSLFFALPVSSRRPFRTSARLIHMPTGSSKKDVSWSMIDRAKPPNQ